MHSECCRLCGRMAGSSCFGNSVHACTTSNASLFSKRAFVNVLSAPLFFALSRTNRAEPKAARLLRGLPLPNIRALDNSTMQKNRNDLKFALFSEWLAVGCELNMPPLTPNPYSTQPHTQPLLNPILNSIIFLCHFQSL